MIAETTIIDLIWPTPARPVEPSPGPWAVHPVTISQTGALILEDANGEIIGWATDAAGHTMEETPPDRRDLAVIQRNAAVMAQAPEMLEIIRIFDRAMRHSRTLRRMLATGDSTLEKLLEEAAPAAKQVLRRIDGVQS